MRGEWGYVERGDGGRVDPAGARGVERGGGRTGDCSRGGGITRLPFSAASLTTPYLLRVAAGDVPGPLASAIRAGLRSLSWLYLTATETSVLAHRAGLLRREQAPCPVISVGNLSVGGTGKSTATAAIARWLLDAGLSPAILSRGYGTRDHPAVRVVSDGREVLLDPESGGDEPVMLARQLAGVPVLVGKRRPLSAAAAVREFGANVCLLDDGFQVWNLRKDLDIVLLDSRRPFDNGFVLPRGMLREPPEHLARAQAVVLMETDGVDPEALARLRARVHELAPGVLVAEASRVPDRLRDLATGAELPLDSLADLPVVALSAIGNPRGFEALLTRLGAVVRPVRLPDHHPYTPGDLARVRRLAGEVGARAIVTTDKDAVKLSACGIEEAVSAAGKAEQGPVWVLTIRLRFTAGGDALRERILSVARRSA